MEPAPVPNESPVDESPPKVDPAPPPAAPAPAPPPLRLSGLAVISLMLGVAGYVPFVALAFYSLVRIFTR